MLKGGLGNLMKQAQEMQGKMQEAQEQLANEEVNGEAGGGLVKIVMNGKYQVRKVSIDYAGIGDDQEMLEDLIAAAVNDASHKVQNLTSERMSGLAGGMGLPAGMKLPF
ncbi:MAG: YbaB/EbfC family nucleoid-associated protein [gamma proteobacterium symbiont of Bathyaustriella thionipta]|nr:YbaB/EbfC family nucleoid-associated protein [gamma proteobacterium symbiont of Bathyaustriella thionipta]